MSGPSIQTRRHPGDRLPRWGCDPGCAGGIPIDPGSTPAKRAGRGTAPGVIRQGRLTAGEPALASGFASRGGVRSNPVRSRPRGVIALDRPQRNRRIPSRSNELAVNNAPLLPFARSHPLLHKTRPHIASKYCRPAGLAIICYRAILSPLRLGTQHHGPPKPTGKECNR